MIGTKPYAKLKYREVKGREMAYIDEGEGDARFVTPSDQRAESKRRRRSSGGKPKLQELVFFSRGNGNAKCGSLIP